MEIKINEENFDKLDAYEQILKKDKSRMINEALEVYFELEQKKLLEKNIEDENAMTNLDFDEFWDGVDI